LELDENGIGDAGVMALVASDLPRLTRLSLNQNRTGPEGTKALVDWPRLGQLEKLNVDHNPLGVGLRVLP
jgi:Leucine Rich repeat